jgi:hypothetical protein
MDAISRTIIGPARCRPCATTLPAMCPCEPPCQLWEKRKGREGEVNYGRVGDEGVHGRRERVTYLTSQGVQIRLEKTKIHWNEILGLGDVIGDEPAKARLPLPVKSDAPILLCL